jgi:hypothetical protein
VETREFCGTALASNRVFPQPARTQREYSVACSTELLGSLSEFPDPRLDQGPNLHKKQAWHGSCSFTFRNLKELGEVILKVNIDNIGELAIVECEGRIVQSEAAFKTLSHLKAMLVRWFLK